MECGGGGGGGGDGKGGGRCTVGQVTSGTKDRLYRWGRPSSLHAIRLRVRACVVRVCVRACVCV